MIFEALSEAAERGELLLVNGGLCRFHLRRDGVCVIREVLVLQDCRHRGIGRRLIHEARGGANTVIARCPASSPANGFWLALGFTILTVERTRKGAPLNVWRWPRFATVSITGNRLPEAGTGSVPLPGRIEP